MKIDYGCIPDGKDVLWSLQKRFGNVQFNFSSEETICSVKGPFTELQAFSSELLGCLRSEQRGSNSATTLGRSTVEADGDGDGAASQGAPGTQEEGDATREGYPELWDDFSLVVDSDVYLYMQKFCQEEFGNVLRRYHVCVIDASSDGVTTLYLQAETGDAGAVTALVSAQLEISQLSQQLEIILRKEKFCTRELGSRAKGLAGDLQRLTPHLLCHEDGGYFYLIGNLVDVSQAKQYVQGCITGRRASPEHQLPAASSPAISGLAQIRSKSTVPSRGDPLVADSVPREPSLPRAKSKGERQLAAKFSTSHSNPLLPSLSSQDATSAGQQLPKGLLQTVDYQTSGKQETAAVPELESQLRQAVGSWKAPPGDQAEAPPSVPRSEAWTSLGHIQPSPLPLTSSTVRSLNLFDITGAVDLQVSATRPPLRRANSFSLPKSQWTRESVKDSPPRLWKESRKELESETAKQRSSSATFQRAQSANGALSGLSDLQPVGTVTRHPGVTQQSFSYTGLTLEGPEDQALTELCNCLTKCHDQGVVRRERSKLCLASPLEAKPRVLEVFQRQTLFHQGRLSRDAQQGAIQGETPRTEIQEGASPLGKPGYAGSLPGGRPSSQGQRCPESLMGQTFQSDGKAWPSESPDKATKACQQDHPRNQTAKAKQGLPDQFRWARGYSGATGGGAFSAPARSQSADRRSPPAGEDAAAANLDPSAAGSGRETETETVAGACEVCKSPQGTTCRGQCNRALCRTCVSVGGIAPPSANPSHTTVGTFAASTMSQSLPGYFRDPTLKITYAIPDGVQQVRRSFLSVPDLLPARHKWQL